MSQVMTKGTCYYCKSIISKADMVEHLKNCKERLDILANKKKGIKCFYIFVEGDCTLYWMHIGIPIEATFYDLDRFLRNTWLECCGHMSAFRIGRRSYTSGQKSMKIKLSKALSSGVEFYHEYDFGTTTELRLKVLSEYDGEVKDKSVKLMAKNEPPEIKCVHCGKPAVYICTECVWDEEGELCKQCAKKHDCEEDFFLPIVNSPRVGMCGYGAF